MALYVVIGICALIGSVMLLSAVKLFVQNYVFVRTSTKGFARVISFANARNTDGHRVYLPVLQFKTPEGRSVCFNSTVASDPPAYKIGDQVKIYYPAKNPQAAKVNTIFEIWFVPFIVMFIGAGFSGGAILLYWTK